jgi:hypothetical protein
MPQQLNIHSNNGESQCHDSNKTHVYNDLYKEFKR